MTSLLPSPTETVFIKETRSPAPRVLPFPQEVLPHWGLPVTETLYNESKFLYVNYIINVSKKNPSKLLFLISLTTMFTKNF